MARLRLTSKRLGALRTDRPQEDFWDELTPGLHVRVSGTTGRKTWLVRYRPNGNGKQRRQKLGNYPAMSLAEARDKARETIAAVDAGQDPAKVRADAKEVTTTFRALADEVLEAKARRTRQRTQAERRRLLDREILPKWGDEEAAAITRRDVVTLVEAIADRGAPTLANRVLALVRLVFNEGLRRGFPTLEANPAHMVEEPGVEEGRDRYLSAQEIRKVWDATEPENPLTRSAFRLALLTGQRIGSVLAMRWDGLNGDLWTIPEEHFKGKRPHLVPLSSEALAIIEEIRADAMSEEWVFPSRSGSKEPHLTNFGKALIRIRKRSKVADWTLHDFRTTWRTHATRAKEDGGLGLPGHVADAVLGHKEASLGFDRYTGDRDRYLLHEKRDALVRWCEWVREAVGS